MYRILIWGCGLFYGRYINAIKYQEISGSIKIIGVTDQNSLYTKLDGYSFINISEIDINMIDYVVVTSDRDFVEISMEAKRIGFVEESIISASVFSIPGFCFKNYVELFHSKVSIIANNCWGGCAYHELRMKFGSPFINMFERDLDYIKLLKNLKYYLSLQLKFKKYAYNDELKINYPVCMLDDVELYFNHYSSLEDVERKWYERVNRINWDNLFIMMFTEDEKVLEIFDSLDYSKKVCFVPFKSDYQSAFFMQIVKNKEMYNIPFYDVVNKTVKGFFYDYDLIKLLSIGVVNHDRIR